MTDRPHEIIYTHRLDTGQVIFEVKYLDVDESAEPKDKYEWFIACSYEWIPLVFKKMEGSKRWFEDGIEFDMETGIMTISR